MKLGLFLDDERNPENVVWGVLGTSNTLPNDVKWDVVRTRKEFTHALKIGVYTYFSFDHDIQDFTTIKKGTLLDASIFGSVYQEEDQVVENTGYHCAQDLKDAFLFEGCSVDGFYVHSRNPIGAKKIYNILKDLC